MNGKEVLFLKDGLKDFSRTVISGNPRIAILKYVSIGLGAEFLALVFCTMLSLMRSLKIVQHHLWPSNADPPVALIAR